MTTQPPTAWRTGYFLLLVIPFIGLGLTLVDLPRWAQIVGVLAILSLVFIGTRLMNRRQGGWRPSDNLPNP